MSLLVCMSAKSAFYDEFAVPALPVSLVCLLCLVELLCRRRYVYSCTDRYGGYWPSWIGQVPVRVRRHLSVGLE